jgi:uncharacterized protein
MVCGTCSDSRLENKVVKRRALGSVSAQRFDRARALRAGRFQPKLQASGKRGLALGRCFQRGMVQEMAPPLDPDYFTRQPPPGFSRESGLRLDNMGRFWHEGELVTHARLNQALHRWIARHPGDGRYILNNEYLWLYITVDDVPYFVCSVTLKDAPLLHLSDGTTEPFPASGYFVGADEALYCPVKNGQFTARFLPSAQNALGPLLESVDGGFYLRIDGALVPIRAREAD